MPKTKTALEVTTGNVFTFTAPPDLPGAHERYVCLTNRDLRLTPTRQRRLVVAPEDDWPTLIRVLVIDVDAEAAVEVGRLEPLQLGYLNLAIWTADEES